MDNLAELADDNRIRTEVSSRLCLNLVMALLFKMEERSIISISERQAIVARSLLEIDSKSLAKLHRRPGECEGTTELKIMDVCSQLLKVLGERE